MPAFWYKVSDILYGLNGMPLKKRVPAAKPAERPAVKRSAIQETVTQRTRKDLKSSQTSMDAASSNSLGTAWNAARMFQMQKGIANAV